MLRETLRTGQLIVAFAKLPRRSETRERRSYSPNPLSVDFPSLLGDRSAVFLAKACSLRGFSAGCHAIVPFNAIGKIDSFPPTALTTRIRPISNQKSAAAMATVG